MDADSCHGGDFIMTTKVKATGSRKILYINRVHDLFNYEGKGD